MIITTVACCKCDMSGWRSVEVDFERAQLGYTEIV